MAYEMPQMKKDMRRFKCTMEKTTFKHPKGFDAISKR